jgi:hypothetical protein
MFGVSEGPKFQIAGDADEHESNQMFFGTGKVDERHRRRAIQW